MESKNSLSLGQSVSYAIPTIAIYFLFGPLFILQGIYSKYFGMALTTIAGVLFFANLLDAATDPLVGYLSDRYYRVTGKRKPFILIGALLFLISSYFLYMPPDDVSALYLFSWYVTVTLMLKIFDIPHLAWPSEITRCPKDRNKLYSLRFFLVSAGSLLFYAMTQLPYFSSSEITPSKLQWCLIVGGMVLIPTLIICLISVPSRTAQAWDSVHYQFDGRSLFNVIFLNYPFLLFLLAILLFGSGVSIWTSLIFIYTDSYLDIGENFAQIYIVSNLASMAALYFSYRAANRFGNYKIALLSIFLVILGLFITGIVTHDSSAVFHLSIAVILVNIGSATFASMAASLMSHIVDYGIWKFRKDHAATYFSVYTMILKVNFALGSAIGLGIAGWYGFDPSSVSENDLGGVFGLRLAISWIPSCIALIGLVVMASFSIDSRRHKVILNRVRGRASRRLTAV